MLQRRSRGRGCVGRWGQFTRHDGLLPGLAHPCLVLDGEEGQSNSAVTGKEEGYLRCYPWDQEHRWDPGVRRGHEHRGSQERQQCQERPTGGRRDGEAAGKNWLPRADRLQRTEGQETATYSCTFGTRLTIATRVALGERRQEEGYHRRQQGNEQEPGGVVQFHSQ